MMNKSCRRQVFLVILGKWKTLLKSRQLIIGTMYGECTTYTLCMPYLETHINMKKTVSNGILVNQCLPSEELKC